MKESVEAEYCHPAGLTYMQCMSCKLLDWISPKSWNQDCWEKYQQPQICECYNSNGRKRRGTKEPPMRVKEENEKDGLKLNIKKAKIMSSGPISSVQFSSAAQLCPKLCNPMNCSTPVLPVHHQLPEFTQTHVHRVSDVIQPSHPMSSPSPPAPNPSQHQDLSNESTLA